MEVRKLVAINASHFCAAVELSIPREGEPGEWMVDNAAPILRYMMGWRLDSVVNYCRRKGWQWRVYEDNDE